MNSDSPTEGNVRRRTFVNSQLCLESLLVFFFAGRKQQQFKINGLLAQLGLKLIELLKNADIVGIFFKKKKLRRGHEIL
jgi:hypothetical protein